jgi:branched-chain amino acid transport system substrate-binding protein
MIRSHRLTTRAVCLAVVASLAAAACGDDGGDDDAGGSVPEATDSATDEEPAGTEPGGTTLEAPDDAVASGDPIVIGVASSLSGPISFYDGPILEAARLAVADINAAGTLDREMVIVTADNESDIANAEAAANEVLDQGADLLITTCDFDFGSPAVRAATERGVVAMGCASSPDYGFEGLGELAFNTFGADITESSSMAQFTYDEGYRNAFLFQDQGLQATISVCDTFETVFTELGGNIVGTATFEGSDFSLAPQLGELRGSDADVVILCSTQATAVKQIRDESELPIVSQVALEGEFWLDCCPGLSDFYAVGLGSTRGDDPDPARSKFFADYEAATGSKMDVSIGMTGYAAIQAFAKAVEQAGTTDGAAVADALQTFTDVELVTGPTTYTETCHIPLGRPMVMMQVQDGVLAYKADVTPTVVPESVC